VQLAAARRLDGAGAAADIRPDVGEVALLPGTGGNFEIRVDGELIWERKRDGGFPGPKELKQRVRDIIEPDRDLGHTDRASSEP
jgi:selenoprotein W-related protein